MADNQIQPGLISNLGQFGASDSSTVGDIAYGAQLGYGPNLPQIDGSTPMVLSPIVAVVTHTPTMFKNFGDASKILKALVERHAKEISGIDFQYEMEEGRTPVGQDGQELSMPITSKRSQVSPQFTWQELKGNLVWNFHKNWLWMIKQPDTQASLLSAINPDSSMSPVLMSNFCMDVMFIQYDETMLPQNIINAFFVTNMWPKETGMIGAKRSIGKGEIIERVITYHGVLQHNRNTKTAGQLIAQALGLHRVNFEFSTPVATQVEAAIVDSGLQQSADQQVGSEGNPFGTPPFSDMDREHGGNFSYNRPGVADPNSSIAQV